MLRFGCVQYIGRMKPTRFSFFVLAFLCIGTLVMAAEERAGEERKKIFAGHFANIGRLADEGKLAVAGPFGKNDKAYRGLYIFNVATIEEAEKLVIAKPKS